MFKHFCAAAALLLAGPAIAQDDVPEWIPGERQYSPYPSQVFPNNVLFGDTHLHTSYSADAGMIGNTLGPADAYRFAKGETMTSSMGVPARLVRPLDFLVVADHAEGLGVAPMIARADPKLLAEPLGQQLYDFASQGTAEGAGQAFNLYKVSRAEGTNPFILDTSYAIDPWEEIVDAAEAANEPGRFSAIIGFEFTGVARNGDSLHRIVVFRDGKDVANAQVPLSAAFDTNPETLWKWMAEIEERTGGRLVVIPHNGNQSNGSMFDDVRYESKEPIDAEYAAMRQRFEPLYEVTQIKGDGEAHPMLSPDDPFADFATWDAGNPAGEAKTSDMLPREYARAALKRGLAYQKSLGVNPFKFGMIGSTDSHTSLSTTRENNFFGKVAQLEPTADPVRFQEPIANRLGGKIKTTRAWETQAAGLAAVWAQENTREAIFDAMMRKEVYATTGTRIRVRVFAGYDFQESDLPRSDFAAHGYLNGVPMGGDLGNGGGRAPQFLIRALRDPDGANLDRIQVIKGWLNEDGTTSESIYDVACGNREVIDGACDGNVGNTVNANEATYTNSIGQAILAAYWEDPHFDPGQLAFYYIRVLEIPTPRWTTYDRKFFGVKLPPEAPISIQERAYTSPVWYTPEN